ncbi:MAG: hypothetical protein WCD81_00785 [Candidatus Bathyarchaeia archaeon]
MGIRGMYRLAKLTATQLNDIRKLEAKWKGVVVLAYEKAPEPANLSEEQLRRLQKLEKELGVVLIAYK